VACLAAVLVFHAAADSFTSLSVRAAALLTLFLAAVAPLVVTEIVRMLRQRNLVITTQGRGADLALVTSAVLMGLSDKGVAGKGAMGLWGPAVFTIPLLAAWYSYEHLDEIRRTYRQTIRALGAAPELGRIVREGHSERVASLTVDIGHELGLSNAEIEQVETAALLHHLGEVCLDEPENGRRPDPALVAEAGAAILRTTELLAPAGDIIAAETTPPRGDARGAGLSGQVLKVASTFDELSEGRSDRADVALEALYSAPRFLYDERVLHALELVLDRRGALSCA
jgi:hypothetical protein